MSASSYNFARAVKSELWRIREIAIRRRMVASLWLSMRFPRRLTGDAPAVVSLTSHGSRIKYVHYTIQSISNGHPRPTRMVLWISNSDAHLVTPELRRLEGRGLEIKLTKDYGPHKKYYPYCLAASQSTTPSLPLVTADDDVLYPQHWLKDLIDAAAIVPCPVVVAHRSHRMNIVEGTVLPYLKWGLEKGTVEPAYANVATGVCGVLYPPEFISQIALSTEAEFAHAALLADDLWLHSRGVLWGIPTKQVAHLSPKIIEHHPGGDSLSDINVTGRNNDMVVSKLYKPELISIIQRSSTGYIG
jgi:hypothetical protein